MKKIYTFCLSLLTVASFAQVPTNFGTNAGDGLSYQEYNLIDHGAVSSVRFQAQNAIPEGQAEWNFFTGDYFNNWRPYTAQDTLSSLNAIIDPSIESSSARFNSNYGGQPGYLPAIQAGYYYTAIVQNGTGDNFMSIVETDFPPVAIDTVYTTPTEPTETDNIVFTVELDGAMMLSPGEHVFLRSSVDGYATSQFAEVTNFSAGVGTFTVPGGNIPAGTTVNYYALVTAEAAPVHETIDYFTLFFANNAGDNYEFTVSSVTGIEDVKAEYGISQSNGNINIKNATGISAAELVSLGGKVVSTTTIASANANVSTNGIAKGIYVLNLLGNNIQKSTKVLID